MRWTMAGLVALALAAATPCTAAQPEAQPEAQPAADSVASAAPAAWLQADPADSLYRSARLALSRGRYQEAADLFHRITTRYPKSGYAPDALYWEAFARYRLGGAANLRAARRQLQRQERLHPRAATRGDAAALTARIDGELARQGDAEAAERLTEYGAAIAPPAPPAAPAAPATPAAPAAPPAVGSVRPGKAPRPPRAPRAPRGIGSRDACANEDDVKITALNALLQMDEERAVPILKRVLARRDAESTCLRRKAVFLVSQKRTAETETILLDAARNDPDGEVRGQAVFWLSQVGTERSTAALDSILRSSKDPEIQDKAVFALSQQGTARSNAALRAYAERADVPAEMREKAIFWIGQSGGAENGAWLRGLYGRLRDEELKEKVIFSLSQQGGRENGRWLVDVAKNANEPVEMRKKALFWAGQTGSLTGADLGALYDTMRDREMKEQIIFSLSQMNDARAMDKLIAIARRDPDPELRKKALFWVGQSNDPRAAEMLEAVLEGR